MIYYLNVYTQADTERQMRGAENHNTASSIGV